MSTGLIRTVLNNSLEQIEKNSSIWGLILKIFLEIPEFFIALSSNLYEFNDI